MVKHPDLHLHSNVSDGSDTPTELLERVRKTDIDAFSLTDHDAYLGNEEIIRSLRDGDPLFLNGVEFSCRDEKGRYHILGYGFDSHELSIREAVEITHNARRQKADNRVRFLQEDFGFEFTDEEIAALLKNENPGKPHFVSLLVKKGYVNSRAEGFELMSRYHGSERRLKPEEAVRAITESGGIPVLAHGILADGSANLTKEEISARVELLVPFGLRGLECYYSSYTPEQTEIMLNLADRHHLLVTAGSDYHGTNKKVPLGASGNPDPARTADFFEEAEKIIRNRK